MDPSGNLSTQILLILVLRDCLRVAQPTKDDAIG